MKTALLAVVSMMAAAQMLGCGSDSTTTPNTADGGSGGSSGTGATVSVSSNTFTPSSVTIKAGQSVKWTWTAGNHNVVSGVTCGSGDGKFTSGAPQTGGEYSFTFTQAGTYPYYCDPHCGQGMKGSVTVTP